MAEIGGLFILPSPEGPEQDYPMATLVVVDDSGHTVFGPSSQASCFAFKAGAIWAEARLAE